MAKSSELVDGTTCLFGVLKLYKANDFTDAACMCTCIRQSHRLSVFVPWDGMEFTF